MIRVAIPLTVGGKSWLGGTNYFRNLLRATNLYSDGRYELTLLVDNPAPFEEAAGPYGKVRHCAAVNWKSGVAPMAGKLAIECGRHDANLLRVIERGGFDLISHRHIGSQHRIPTIPWMPDFQHRALPELFVRRELARRDRNVRAMAGLGRLLLSSEAARQDFVRYYPEWAATTRTYVLRFASAEIAATTEKIAPLIDLQKRYGIPERFFYVANQFWAHKNHKVLVDALGKVGDGIAIVCSGDAADYRGGGHFQELIDAADAQGVRDRFMTLGIVPYADVQALMRHSVAVINPSLFEGWSTGVEEAKAIGKRMVLSSIPVHLEQAPDAHFFPPHDADRLAAALDHVWHDSGGHVRGEHELKIMHDIRVGSFVDTYFKIISEVVGSASPKGCP